MKTINRNPVLIASLCALTLTFSAAAYAEKGAERLVNLTRASTPALVKIAPPVAHKCGNCTDSLISISDKATKGPNHLVSKVARHDCATCDTKIVTAGVG